MNASSEMKTTISLNKSDGYRPPIQLKLLLPMRLLLFPLFLLLAAAPIAPAATTFTQTWNVSAVIPDNDDVGFADTRTVGMGAGMTVEEVEVNLSFTAGWNGDLYAYLVHGSGFSVLLNRPGRSLGEPDGAASSGMNVTFRDDAATDLHTTIPMSGGSFTGTYQPSARNIDPLVSLDDSPRTAFLASFTGIDPNGNWTLFVADQSAGQTSTLQSWSLTVTAVPEPSAAVLGMLGVAILLRRSRKGGEYPSQEAFNGNLAGQVASP